MQPKAGWGIITLINELSVYKDESGKSGKHPNNNRHTARLDAQGF
ncbi:MAG: hypothetical protein ACOX3Q_14160 [Clostridia bacterium]